MSSTVLGRFGLVRMSGRDPRQQHRVASSLELFFDLVFVIAVSQASQNLHHGIVEGHAMATVLGPIPQLMIVIGNVLTPGRGYVATSVQMFRN